MIQNTNNQVTIWVDIETPFDVKRGSFVDSNEFTFELPERIDLGKLVDRLVIYIDKLVPEIVSEKFNLVKLFDSKKTFAGKKSRSLIVEFVAEKDIIKLIVEGLITFSDSEVRKIVNELKHKCETNLIYMETSWSVENV